MARFDKVLNHVTGTKPVADSMELIVLSSVRQRAAVLTGAAIGALALVGVSAGIANASTITSGTGTFTVADTYLSQLHSQDISGQATGAQSVTCDQTNTTVVYSATGGDANLNNSAGSVLYSGGITVKNRQNGKQVQFGNLRFDMFNGQIDATPTSGSEVALLDVGGTVSGQVNGSTQTFSASKLVVDAAGATYLDTALGTTAFHAGDLIGSFTTTYTVA